MEIKKNEKPKQVYKKWWFILITLFLLSSAFVGSSWLAAVSSPASIDNIKVAEVETRSVSSRPSPTEALSDVEETQSEPSHPSSPESLPDEVKVTRVIDGDTVELETGQKVRYIGIDTPETVSPSKPVQCFGKEASNKNKELVLGKQVRLEKDVSETDKYGRLLRYVWIGDILINEVLVREGYAQSSTYPPDIKYQDKFLEAQRLAKEENKGLWSACDYFGQPSSVSSATSSPTTQPTTTQTQPTATTQVEDCIIKGNISNSGEKVYHLPGCFSYNQTVINESRGERWFCSEEDAVSTGWRKAKNCP